MSGFSQNLGKSIYVLFMYTDECIHVKNGKIGEVHGDEQVALKHLLHHISSLTSWQ